MKGVRLIVCGLLLTLVLTSLVSVPSQGLLAPSMPVAVSYVDQNATGANNGSSWTDAYTDLYTALLIATSGTEIWVAQGTYKPGIFRTDTFQLKDGVVVYGGFPTGGGLDGLVAFEERDPVAYPTILSGDLGNDADPTNNNYHVVTGSGTNDSATLDGFTVTGGYADGSSPHGDGAGMLNNGGHPTVRNVVFERNTATGYGGGMENVSSSPKLENVAFRGNTALTFDGGGLDNYLGSSPTFFNVVFSGNAAGRFGGGMNNDTTAGEAGSDPHLINATFAGNTAGTAGGAVRNANGSQATLVNSILWDNGTVPMDDCTTCSAQIRYSIVQGGCPANANCADLISGKPLFLEDPDPGSDGMWGTDDDEYGDLRLDHGSDALDAGDDSAIGGTSRDLMGNPRPFDLAEVPDGPGGYVDLGAYEAPASRLYVDWNAAGADTGLTWRDAFGDLLDALTWSRSGPTEVWVAKGTYKPPEARTASFPLLSGVEMYGGFPAGGGDGSLSARDWELHRTTLSGDIGTPFDFEDNTYHVVTGDGAKAGAILDGFEVRYGNASGGKPHNSGGGVTVSNGSPTLRNMLIAYNRALLAGGGLLLDRSESELVNVRFDNNSAARGGGMMSGESEPTLRGVRFWSNQGSDRGGGLACQGGIPILVDATFLRNHAPSGGGMHIWGGAGFLINVEFTRNDAEYGGGLFSAPGSLLQLYNVAFRANQALEQGGGLYGVALDAWLANATFGGNYAEGQGGGSYLSSSSEVAWSNGILWGNSAPSYPQINDQAGNVITLADTLVEGGCLSGWKCEGKILTDDPQFFEDPDPGPDGVWGTSMDENEGDLRLQSDSPAIDAGKNASVPLDFLDIDLDSDTTEPLPYDLLGNPRFVDIPTVVDTGSGTPPIVDMGAYEAMVRAFLPLVARDW